DSNIDPSNRGDLLEAFGIGWKLLVLENDETSGNNDRHKAGTNIWPLEPAGFCEVYHNYYHEALAVGKVLHRLFALALDLPETYFDDKV
ncbi:hypothetical protein SCLCIDRAFT_1165301, partial [Scleroderma citrinum Foug A]